MRRAILLLASLAILAAAAGCASCRHCQSSCYFCSPSGDEMPPPLVERTLQESAIQNLLKPMGARSVSEGNSTLAYASGSDVSAYRALAPQLCQCLAAKHAPMADGFDSQRRQLEQQQAKANCLCGGKSEKQRDFQESMLLYSALESRDQAAGTALEWYYQLAGAEAKADLLNDSLKSGSETLMRIEQLKKQGFPLPSPLEEYQRQILDLQLQQVRDQLTIEQLNTKLRLAMGFHSSPAWRIWPDPSAPLCTETLPEVEAAVNLGLSQRPQLLLLRNMIANLDRDTLGSARSFLQTINPLLAMSKPGPSCKLLKILGKILHIQPGQDDEVERVRAQLNDLLRERERAVAAEIREAVYEIGARREATVLARQAADTWQMRIDDLQKEKSQGLKGAFGLAAAHLDWYKARGEVVKEFLGWKIAAVKLKQAQGILPAECGYSDCKDN
ncbi:MAG: TolC family protein [Gemmataceae bacterium]